MVAVGIVVFVIIMAVAFYVANEFYEIAVDKGYDDKKYLWWTFWLFPIGAAMVIALPDRKNFNRLINSMVNTSNSQEKNNEIIDELPEL